jgi:hypothetical protein
MTEMEIDELNKLNLVLLDQLEPKNLFFVTEKTNKLLEQ